MAATSQPLATQIALEIMRRAAMRSMRRLRPTRRSGLMEPVSNGIGGDLFAIVWDAKAGKLQGLTPAVVHRWD